MLSKNNIGVASTLILVILLSQSRIFNFLIDTALGRMIIIFFILAISYMHKILGFVAVLFIIIMINQSDMRLFESFAEANTCNNPKPPSMEKDKQPKDKKDFFQGREGFNMTDREGTILKGKRSNEVPVLSNSRTQTDDVEPSDKDVYSNSYSSA